MASKKPGLIDRLRGTTPAPKKRAPAKKKAGSKKAATYGIALPERQKQPKKKRTDEEVEDAIIKTMGNIAAAARVLGLRSAYRLRERINGNPELKAALLDAREELLGLAETSLEAQLRAGYWQPTQSVLANFGSAAGWSDAQKIELNSSIDMEIEVTWGDDAPIED